MGSRFVRLDGFVECCDGGERAEPREQDDGSGAHDADRACIGREEGEEEEAEGKRDRHEPPYETANGGFNRQARNEHVVAGVAPIASAHPAYPIMKLTRSLRPAAT